jgi:heme-degrading monooxygenase HmoA
MVRIVKMRFKVEDIPAFLRMFEEKRALIAAFPGCQGVRLLNDVHSPETYYTYSHWNSPADLENYRNSDLFKGVWAETKIKFSDRPEAWSFEEIQ